MSERASERVPSTVRQGLPWDLLHPRSGQAVAPLETGKDTVPLKCGGLGPVLTLAWCPGAREGKDDRAELGRSLPWGLNTN